VSVNLSSRQLADSGLVSNLRSVLQETGIESSWLQLELSENVAMADARLTASVLSQVRQIGVGVILDGFGMGRSSLSELRHFRVDALKIDRSLVGELLANHGPCDVVELIVTLAHKLGLKAAAEGIETAKQLERLREMGCDIGQGHLF
jgi:EAL domain-containing protein (putative c-di-GMP-specific phosphodiesterase class I)